MQEVSFHLKVQGDSRCVGSEGILSLQGPLSHPACAGGRDTELSVAKPLRSLSQSWWFTHQGNPVGVERTQSHLRHKLGAGEEEEVEVEKVLELVKQHLEGREKRKETVKLEACLMRWGGFSGR